MKDLARTERLIKILQAIDNGNVGVTDLAGRMDVTERQIYRDIHTLRYVLHFPIRADRRRGVYCFEEGYSLKKLTLDHDEMVSVLMAKEAIGRIGSPHAGKFGEVLARSLSASGQGQQTPFSIILDSVVSKEKIEEQYNVLARAIEEQRPVVIEHAGENGRQVSRAIDPYRLFYADGFWYVLAYCHKRKDIRTFALDRIGGLDVQDRHFVVLMGFDADEYLGRSWKSYSLGGPEEVTIRFSPSAAQQIRRKKWHPTQRLRDLEDGHLEFLVTVSGHEEIMRWVLTWGAEAEVIRPRKLRRRISLCLRNAAMLYG